MRITTPCPLHTPSGPPHYRAANPLEGCTVCEGSGMIEAEVSDEDFNRVMNARARAHQNVSLSGTTRTDPPEDVDEPTLSDVRRSAPRER